MYAWLNNLFSVNKVGLHSSNISNKSKKNRKAASRAKKNNMHKTNFIVEIMFKGQQRIQEMKEYH